MSLDRGPHRPKSGSFRRKPAVTEETTARMIGVFVKDGESIDSALKRFKRECINAGIQSEIKRREYYEKPSERRKRKLEAAMRKREKKRLMMLRKDKA